MRAHPRHFRILSVLLSIAAFAFMCLRLDSRPPYQWVTLYGNLSYLCIIGGILSLVTFWFLQLRASATPPPSKSSSLIHPLARLFGLATYLLVAIGILSLAIVEADPSWNRMMLHELGLNSLLMAIITGIAGALCESLVKRQARSQPHDPHPRDTSP